MSFPETSYGIVKRLGTVEAWTASVARRLKKPSLTILDYGCGTGDHVTYPLACLGHRVLGLDFHAASISEASRRYRSPNLSFKKGEIDELVKQGQQFDLIVCSEVLEHLHEPLQFLEAVSRLLPAGGGLIITTPNGYGSFEWLTSLQKALDRAGLHRFFRQVAHLCLRKKPGVRTAQASTRGEGTVPSAGFLNMDSTHVQFFRVGRLEALFAQSGFTIVERRARTLLCGPYVDLLFRLAPFEQALCRANNRLADALPFAWAADWMFLLERREKCVA
ncbi:MAG: protein of unknown function, putative Methyltransferase [Nitrospira sp.]|nr:protein of unknown function, putative Methyltransferase [Nitrospira sp.]